MKYYLTVLFWWICLCSFGQVHTLQDYISQAEQSSPLLKGYQGQVLSLQLDSMILRASLRTQVNFLSNDLYAPTIAGYGYDPALSNIAQVSGLMQASRNFLSGSYIAAQYRSVALQTQALRDTIQLTARDLTRTITDQYITAYGDWLTMNYSRDLYQLLKNEEIALKKLAQASVIRQTDFLAFAVTMQQQELTYLQAQIQYNADYLTLNFLAGMPDTTIGQLTEPQLSQNLPLMADLANSVFIRRFTTDSLRIANEHKLIDYSYRPIISATTDAGYNSSLQDPYYYKQFGFSVGVNIKVPIYDGHQRQFRHRQLNIQEQTRQYFKSFFIQQYNQQVAQLNAQLHATDQLFDKIRTQVDYTRTLITAYGKLLQTGDARVTDLATAVTNYLNAQNVYRQNLISRFRIMNQIIYWTR